MTKRKLSVVKNSTSRQSYSLVSDGKSLLSTCFLHVAEGAVDVFFGDLRSVSLRDNKAKKTIGHFIYGRRQR